MSAAEGSRAILVGADFSRPIGWSLHGRRKVALQGNKIVPSIHAGESLAAAFASLEAERGRNWAPEQLAQNRAQRQALRDALDFAQVVGVGDRLDDFALEDSAGGEIRLTDLIADGPAVLIFFRYADCPADNVALPIYDRALSEPLHAAGVPIVAISPQVPGKLDAIRTRHDLTLGVATDRDNRLARALGLTFTPLATPEPPPAGWIGEITGTGSWELPQTAALIVDRDRVVRFAAISPDWLDRVEPSVIRDALNRIADAGAAAPTTLRSAAS
jgi:peroxiredoxin